MIRIRPAQPADMALRHRAAARPAKEAGPSRLRNVRPLLELGSTTYITFRGAPYGVPPVPWRAGQQLRLLMLDMQRITLPLTPETAPVYDNIIQQLPAMLWRLTQPVRLTHRVLHALGLSRNPFDGATEMELVELASFFLTRRMTSSITTHPAAPLQLSSTS